LKRYKADNTPAVLVVTYGNRAYDDALIELMDIALESGFIPIAGGAFIGEHSFSDDMSPIASGRPDFDDLDIALQFGARVGSQLAQIDHLKTLMPLEVPGNRPYQNPMNMPKMAPISKRDTCTLCGSCLSKCPTEAITKGNQIKTDKHKCTLCHACVKSCPDNARTMRNLMARIARKKLSRDCVNRLIPDIYITQ